MSLLIVFAIVVGALVVGFRVGRRQGQQEAAEIAAEAAKWDVMFWRKDAAAWRYLALKSAYVFGTTEGRDA